MNDDIPEDSKKQDPEKKYARIKSIKTTDFGFFERVIRSVRNVDFYGLVFVESGKRAFFYCLKFCLIVGFLTGLAFGLSHWSVVDRISRELQQQIPKITIVDEDVSVDAETPYRMTIMNDHEFILDPDAKLNRKRLDPDVLLVLVDGAIYVRNSEENFGAWTLKNYTTGAEDKEFVIDASTIANWTQFFKWTLLIASVLGLMVAYVIQGFLRVVLISAGGFFAADSDSDLFGWKSFLKLSCYAVTPVLIADGILFASGISLPYQELFLLGGGTFYMYFIVKHLGGHLKGVRVDLTDEDSRKGTERSGNDSDFDA